MKRNLKRTLSVFLSIVMMLTTLLAVDLGAVMASTTPGDKLTYTLNESTGLLTISGSGPMYDFRAFENKLLGLKQPPWKSKNDMIKKVVINEGVTTVGHYAFFNCVNLVEVQLPSSITEIRGMGEQIQDKNASYGAFQNCTSLKKINFPTGLKTIGDYAFEKCSSLENIDLPNTLTTIGKSAFLECTSLKAVRFPNSVTSLGQTAFMNCTSLTDVEYGTGMTSTGDRAFYGAGVKNVKFSETINTVSAWCFFGTAIANLEIPETVTNLKIRSFSDTYMFTTVIIYNPDIEFEGIIGEDPFNAGNRQVNLTMYGHSGSTTETYAKEKGYAFKSIDNCEHAVTYEKIIVDPTCTEKGSYNVVCSDCQQVLRTMSVDPVGHNYISLVLSDETQINGHKLVNYSCEICRDSYEAIEHQYVVETDENGDEQTSLIKHYVWVDGYYTMTNSATCTRPGLIRYTCTYKGCGQTETRVSQANNHKVENWTTVTKATCETDGKRTGKCTVCGNDVEEILPAIGHKYIDDDLINVDDKTDVDGHKYSNYKCQNCGKTIKIPEHIEWMEEYYTPNVISPARCVVDGLERDTCDICAKTRNVTLKANGQHDWYETNRTSPTCTAVGKIFYACATDGCNFTKSENIDALGHDYVAVPGLAKDPTCLSAGYITYQCSRCAVQKQETVPAPGHTPDESSYVVSAEPDCENEGEFSATCTVCGKSYTTKVKALGHDYVDVEVPMDKTWVGHVKATPTCTRPGCKSTQSAEIKHKEWIEGKYDVENVTDAACIVQGRIRFRCIMCNATETFTSPALGHCYVATGTVSENANVYYQCKYCNTVGVKKPSAISAMWDTKYLAMSNFNRTATDDSSYLDVDGDGYISARDYLLLRDLLKKEQEANAIEPETPGVAPSMQQFVYYHMDDVMLAGITYTDRNGEEITLEGIKDMTAEEAEEAGLLYNGVAYPITAWPEYLENDMVPPADDPSLADDPYGAENSPARYYYCINPTTGNVVRTLKNSRTGVASFQTMIAQPYYTAYVTKNNLTIRDSSGQKNK